MGLLMLLGSIAIFAMFLIIGMIKDNPVWMVGWFLILALVIPLSIVADAPPSASAYKYETEITMPNDTQGSHTTIYFNEFVQDGDKVTINNFVTTHHIHWTAFNHIEKSAKAVIITLKDNNGRFIYTDRVTETTYNDNVVATQP